jgi:hypothetical protein
MSDYRQTIEEYLRVSEALLQMEELTDAEMEADKVLNDASLQ